MRIVREYECEICGQRYMTPPSAEKCEARGFAIPYPPGTLFSGVGGSTMVVLSNEADGHDNMAKVALCRHSGLRLVEKPSRASWFLVLDEGNALDVDRRTFDHLTASEVVSGMILYAWNGREVEGLQSYIDRRKANA